jgi:hypothetical protein
MEWNGMVGGPRGGKKLLGPPYKVGARLEISIFTKIDSLAGNFFFLIFSFYKSFLTIFRFFENFKNLFLDFCIFAVMMLSDLCIDVLAVAATTIQKQYRLWSARRLLQQQLNVQILMVGAFCFSPLLSHSLGLLIQSPMMTIPAIGSVSMPLRCL